MNLSKMNHLLSIEADYKKLVEALQKLIAPAKKRLMHTNQTQCKTVNYFTSIRAQHFCYRNSRVCKTTTQKMLVFIYHVFLAHPFVIAQSRFPCFTDLRFGNAIDDLLPK